MNERTQQIDIVFDGPPGPVPGRFVEVEDLNEASIRVGRWIDRGNGLWALRLTAVVNTDPRPAIARVDNFMVQAQSAERMERERRLGLDPDYTCGAAYCDDPACNAHSYTPEMVAKRESA